MIADAPDRGIRGSLRGVERRRGVDLARAEAVLQDLVVHRGFAFGFDGNILAAIDIATGDRAWKGGRYGNGQMLLLPEQDLLLVLSERGELALVRASPERFEEVARMQALEGKTWNHPVVAAGMIYLRNAEEAATYRLPA